MASTAAPSHALSLPSPLLSRAPRPLPLFSAQQRFIAKASELPVVGNTAPDFKAEAVFDQECTNNKMQHNTTSTLLPSLLTPTPKLHHFTCSATITTPKPLHTASLAPKPTTKHITHPHNDFQEKLLYLDSLGLDYLTLLNSHPPLLTSPLSNLKSLIDHLTFLTLTPLELQRIFGMCPQLLTLSRKDIAPVLSFLLREVRIPHTQLKKAINRRPRLLLSDVDTRLRPTLYFLQRIGVEDLARHTHLLSCSVEDKFLPRIEYFEGIGFENGDAVAMFRRFPQLFCYSVEGNFKPKVDYFLGEMGRELGELKEFPQYFSFSLEKRIKPRHQRCVEKGVCFPLPFLLKSSEGRFQDRLDSYFGSSLPVKDSPLWCTNSEVD